MFFIHPITFNMFLPVGGTLEFVIQLVNRSRNNINNSKTHNHLVFSAVIDIITDIKLPSTTEYPIWFDFQQFFDKKIEIFCDT